MVIFADRNLAQLSAPDLLVIDAHALAALQIFCCRPAAPSCLEIKSFVFRNDLPPYGLTEEGLLTLPSSKVNPSKIEFFSLVASTTRALLQHFVHNAVFSNLYTLCLDYAFTLLLLQTFPSKFPGLENLFSNQTSTPCTSNIRAPIRPGLVRARSGR